MFSPGFTSGVKPVFYISFAFFAVFSLKAQENLVPNGSFEEYNWCPSGVADFSVSYWYPPTWGTCDYFHTCNTLSGVPNNYFGNQNPQDGNAYVGFGVVFDSLNIYREYIQVELINTLQSDKYYYFSCFLNKADSSSICIKDIGIALSDNQIGGQYLHKINFSPQFINSSAGITCDEDNWNKIEFIFRANGDEKFLTIGYFDDDVSLDTNIVKYSGQGLFAYCYVDNVILIETQINIPNVFTPNNDGVNDVFKIEGLSDDFSLIIFNRWGERVFHTNNANMEFWNGKLNGKNCSDGVYFYILNNDNNFEKTGFIHLIR